MSESNARSKKWSAELREWLPAWLFLRPPHLVAGPANVRRPKITLANRHGGWDEDPETGDHEGIVAAAIARIPSGSG